MSYNPNIPIGTDPMAVSQPQVLNNFTAINSAWSVDHIPLTATDNVGMHNALNMVKQSGTPRTSSSQVGLYVAADGSGNPQIFYCPNSSQTPIQLTLSAINVGATVQNQYSYMAGPFYVFIGNTGVEASGYVWTPQISGRTLIYAQATAATVKNTKGEQIGYTVLTSISGGTVIFTYNTQPNTPNANMYYLVVAV
jgi:hypothetical protein